MKFLVIACYTEDLGWLSQIPKDWTTLVYNKGENTFQALPNIGREAHTYLHALVAHYHWWKKDGCEVVFCQGNPFDHDREFIAHLGDESVRWYGPFNGCPASGWPHMEDAHLDEHCRVLGLPTPQEYRFVAGAQYRVTAEQIRSRPLAFYECLLALTKLMPRAPYSLERLWPIIWNVELP